MVSRSQALDSLSYPSIRSIDGGKARCLCPNISVLKKYVKSVGQAYTCS